ncbi:GNAT family N-acetyltransferase [Parashewanella spongiae]|uniref:GNAT family N-acetyltransferase n=1 Tax=Parashewanella spongiae TaxID=342950 RepID=A0A3A6TMN7_9GAMM|nr:GNAT family N-acetyltransferase [Parashewanella spongiae]MCL1078820.1 GNAT family N-acetyltransferase [Parashewanella spongiae]RJY11901.1 GNAT family N-acetyltransferase [Parashewanella spongiae]
MKLDYRNAQKNDLETLITLLSDDDLGRKREDTSKPINTSYLTAFEHIEQDPNNELVVIEFQQQAVSMLQLTFIPYLTHTGSWRCIIEGVRIHSDFRGKGIGEQMFLWAINRAKQRQCHLVQLTSDKQRPDAIRFYEKLSFIASHEGFKLVLK